MGTASYFSPEQAQGAQPDPRSDLYSLGIVMYEMVAGQPPFTGENPVSIAYKQVHDQPQPLNQIVDDVPRPVRGDRRQAAGQGPEAALLDGDHALRDDLRRFRNGEQVQALAAAAGVARAATGPVTAATPTAATTVAMGDEHRVASAPSPRPAPPVNGLPTGASQAARYYEPPPSRTGWYALAAFFALDRPRHRRRAAVQRPLGRRRPRQQRAQELRGDATQQAIADLDSARPHVRGDPRGRTRRSPRTSSTGPIRPPGSIVVDNQVIRLFYNPREGAGGGPQRRGSATRRRPAHPQPGRVHSRQRQRHRARGQRSDRRERRDPHRPGRRSQVEQSTTIKLFVSSGPDQIAMPRDRRRPDPGRGHRTPRGGAVQLQGQRHDGGDQRRSPRASSSAPTRRPDRSSTRAVR